MQELAHDAEAGELCSRQPLAHGRASLDEGWASARKRAAPTSRQRRVMTDDGMDWCSQGSRK